MAIGATLLSFFTGGAFKSISGELREAYEAKLNAQNDADRLKADQRIASLNARVEAQTRGAGSFLPKLIRGAFALPFVIYTGKVVVWDKVLGWGVTDPLGDNMGRVFLIVLTFYFLDNSVRLMRR